MGLPQAQAAGLFACIFLAAAPLLSSEQQFCSCSKDLEAWHQDQLVPLRQRSRASLDAYRPAAALACGVAEEAFGERLHRSLQVDNGQMQLTDCPQLLFIIAATCVGGSPSTGEVPPGVRAELQAFWVSAAGALVKAAKVHCISEWISAGIPSVSVSEIQWNVERFSSQPDGFQWTPWAVPSYVGQVRHAPAQHGLLMAAAAEWAYDGAEVGDVCRGGDLGCFGEGHCYAFALDRALLAWAPSVRGTPAEEPVRLLELGICAGHSLAAWQRYLSARFPAAGGAIAAVDLDLSTLRRHLPTLRRRGFDESRVEVAEANLRTLGSQGSLDAMLTANGPFDIIVDDASHADEEIVSAFEHLFFDEHMGLAPGGVYIVLDTQASYRDGGTRLSHFKQLADEMQWSGTTIVSLEQLELFVAHTGSRAEAWVEAVEFHRGLILVRKRGTRTP
mmetsp:Transcript_40669/g.128839  ORF Transcript_40669/g.128839 Transcript_40669/m.128839 type:complete len:446 (-) Transcript_40669:80-1417(-)